MEENTRHQCDSQISYVSIEKEVHVEFSEDEVEKENDEKESLKLITMRSSNKSSEQLTDVTSPCCSLDYSGSG